MIHRRQVVVVLTLDSSQVDASVDAQHDSHQKKRGVLGYRSFDTSLPTGRAAVHLQQVVR